MSPRQLGAAILISIVSGAIFYMLIIFAVSMSMPWTESAHLPMTTSAVFEAAFGFTWAAKLVICAALLGLVSTLNGMYVASSRLLFALGRGGMLPQWFAYVHPEHHTPQNAVLFVGVISLLGPFVGKFLLTPIVNTGSFVFMVAVGVVCASAIRLRRSAAGLERPYRAPTAALYVGAMMSVALILLMVLPQSPGQLGNLEFLIVFTWFALGLALSLWRRHRHPLDKDTTDYLVLGDYR